MTKSALWLSVQDVTSLVSLEDAITALEAGLRSQVNGEGQNISKALAAYGDSSSMHSLGSALPALGYCGYKNWVHTKRGAKAVFVLFDASEGRLLSVMEANSLGQLRTAAMTGLGTKWMAREGANDMAIIGTHLHPYAALFQTSKNAVICKHHVLNNCRRWQAGNNDVYIFC